MAKEYKFMFDRRFDEPEEDMSLDSASSRGVSGEKVPSISEILDTLAEQLPLNRETEESPEEKTGQTFSEQEEQAPVSAPEPAAEPVPVYPSLPSFSGEELEIARTTAFDEGFQKGLAEGQENTWKEALSSIQKQEADSIQLIAENLKKIQPVCQQASETAFNTAMEFAMAVCRKVMPLLSEKEGLKEIRNLLEENFHFLKEEPKITIRLHPELAEPIKKHIAEIVVKESFPGKIGVIRDDSIVKGDCKIEWKNGGLERKTEDVLNQAEELVKLYEQAARAKEKRAKNTSGEENGGNTQK